MLREKTKDFRGALNRPSGHNDGINSRLLEESAPDHEP